MKQIVRCIGGFYKLALSDFGIIFEDNRRTSERRAELARAIPSAEEEGEANLRFEPKRIQKITKRQPNEQREQKPLSATAESSCLDYAESQVRKKYSTHNY